MFRVILSLIVIKFAKKRTRIYNPNNYYRKKLIEIVPHKWLVRM